MEMDNKVIVLLQVMLLCFERDLRIVFYSWRCGNNLDVGRRGVVVFKKASLILKSTKRIFLRFVLL